MSAEQLPFASIVVPLYNEESRIDECIRSLLAQDYPAERYEVLVIDNNSTDRSAERASAYPRVRLLHEKTQGDWAARNAGIRESRGEIIAFTDSDTAPKPEWLRAIAGHLRNGGPDLLLGRVEFSGNSRMLRLLEMYEAEKGEFVFGSGIPEIYYGYTCNMAVRRSLIDRLGPFPPMFRNADVLLVRRTVDELSPRALAFCDAMRVRRLEVGSVGQYLDKQMIYGRDFPRYATTAAASTLSGAQRMEVFRRTVRKNRLGVIDAARLFVLLGVGALAYEAARIRSTAHNRAPVAS